jgi:anti-sigma B factor antagonist
MELNANVRFVNGIAVVDLEGRLTLDAAGERLRDQLIQLFEDGSSRILLNLSAVQHADSGGLGDLVAAYAALTRRGGNVKLTQPPGKIRTMLRMTHIDELFEIFDDEGAALAAFPPAEPERRPAASLSDFLND